MDRPTVVDRPLRVALVSMKTVAMALLVAAAAFAPANRSVDLQEAVSHSLEQDRAADQRGVGPITSSGEADSSKIEQAPTADPAGLAGDGTASPRPLPPTDTLP
jgi:hypothetical protein